MKHRKAVNKAKSAHKFRKQIKKTKKANLIGPMRGGIRL